MKIGVICGHLESLLPLARYTVHINKADYCNRHGYSLMVPTTILAQHQDPKSHAGGFTWSRLDFLLRTIESGKYDWVWTVGADTLITNFTIAMEDIIATAMTQEAERTPLPVCHDFPGSHAPKKVVHLVMPPGHVMTGKKHLLICGERVASVQADSFIMRSSLESADYLRDILSQYQLYKHHPWAENQTLIDMRDKHAAMTCIIPQWKMNSYDYSRWYGLDDRYRDGIDCYGNRGQWQPGDFLIHWPAATLEERLKFLEHYKPLIQL